MRKLSLSVFISIFLVPVPQPLAAAGQATTTATEPIKNSDPKVRAKAARELGRSGDAASIPLLKGALADPDVKVRREAVLALAAIHKSDSLEPLAGASRDADPDIQILAIHCLVGYYTGQTPEAGFTGFMKKNVARAKGLFVADDSRVDPGIAIDPVVLAALENDLSSAQSTQVQRESARGLGTLMARQAVPNLIKAAHASNDDLARQALNSLAKIMDTSAGPPLLDLLDSGSKDVKKDAAETVGILHAQEAIPKLQLMFENNPDKKTKEKALQGLAYLGSPVSLPLFNRELWSSNKLFRTSAAEGMGRAGDKKSVPELQKAVNSEKDGDARLAMEFALAALGEDDYVNTLIQEMDTKVHGDSAQTYLVELARNPGFLPKLYPYLGNQNATIQGKLAIVLMYSGDSTSIAPLETLSHDSNTDVASAAIRALRAVRVRAAETK